MTGIKPLIAGNWKMNGLRSSTEQIEALMAAVADGELAREVDLLICPPATLIMAYAHILKETPIAVGAQDCHAQASGAFTGEISAQMLADAGASAVILGHSERRSQHAERDADVRAKAEAAHDAGLRAIICVGETAGERRLGLTLGVLARQLSGSVPSRASAANTVIAYEPVWAIGTGLVPSEEQIGEAHAFIRTHLKKTLGESGAEGVRILYGGSVNPDNASAIMTIDSVDGALVGGASLKAESLISIGKAGIRPRIADTVS